MRSSYINECPAQHILSERAGSRNYCLCHQFSKYHIYCLHADHELQIRNFLPRETILFQHIQNCFYNRFHMNKNKNSKKFLVYYCYNLLVLCLSQFLFLFNFVLTIELHHYSILFIFSFYSYYKIFNTRQINPIPNFLLYSISYLEPKVFSVFLSSLMPLQPSKPSASLEFQFRSASTRFCLSRPGDHCAIGAAFIVAPMRLSPFSATCGDTTLLLSGKDQLH